MTLTPMPAENVLDQYFLEARAKLLDLAAILDRIGRGEGDVNNDPRMKRIQRAIEMLHDADRDQADRIQREFSLSYEQGWKKPQPRTADQGLQA